MAIEELHYMKFTGKARFDKFINSLVGLVQGISIDGVINNTEAGLLRLWLSEHKEFAGKHPFNELMPVVENAIADGALDDEERQDILWLCQRLRSKEYYSEVTASLQILHGVLGGIAADGIVTKEELQGLSKWLGDNDHLRSYWPYDEVDSLITSVLKDGVVDNTEQKALQNFFSEFVSLLDDKTITQPAMTKDTKVTGVCAVCPEIIFTDSNFCFTGESARFPRKELAKLVHSLGGAAHSSVSKKIHYLIIGAEGNPCWAYSCYGRKVERAIELRKQGANLLIVHEHDFHDAVADA